MVKHAREPVLDRTFAALADPTRRALLERLSEDRGISVSELARPLPLSLPAVMKHLDVLSQAGLIARSKSGRTVTCRLEAAPMRDAMSWLNRYERFWSASLDRLAAYLEEESCPSAKPEPPAPARRRDSPVSRSSAASRRRRNGSSGPGPSRET